MFGGRLHLPDLLAFLACARFIGLLGDEPPNRCWREGFNEARCCTEKDPSCWDGIFTDARCCPRHSMFNDSSQSTLITAPKGNPRCWVGGFSYEDCCGTNPIKDCWDSEFNAARCCVEVPGSDSMQLGVLEQDLEEAFIDRMAIAADGELGCEDSPPGLWRSAKIAATQLNVSMRYGMPGIMPSNETMSRMVQAVLSWIRSSDSWEMASAACPWGALDVIDLAAPYIDRNMGEMEARQAYRLHQSLLSKIEVSSTWPLLVDARSFSPRMLGLTPEHSCYGTKLRIFIYRVPALSHMTGPVLTCSQKMSQCAASVHIHRWLEAGSCTTEDPDAADFFYLPAYEACYNETACGFGAEWDSERCFPTSFNPVSDLAHFARRRGADHIFLFGCNLLRFSDPLMIQTRQSIMVTVESYQDADQPGISGGMLAWFSHWKDVLIPGYIPEWRINAMLAFNRPTIKRAMLLTFHGHSASSPNVGHMYKRSRLAQVRDRILDYFANVTGASVGPPVRDYFERMGSSRFCLVPAGLTAWTIHLYEAFFFGCVPVILSDELTMPFQTHIDWPSLSLHVPSSIPMEELHAKLHGFSIGRLKRMYRNLNDARCWLDYSRGWELSPVPTRVTPGCSPYLGLLTGLEARAVRSAGSVGRGSDLYGLSPFWEPPPEV